MVVEIFCTSNVCVYQLPGVISLYSCREYWVRDGVVTGGQYGSHSGCMPYTLPHYDHHEPGPYPNCTGETKTPACTSSCEAGKW